MISRKIHDVTVGTVRVRVLEAGEETAPPLLLVHGLLFSHSEWDDIVEPLARRYRVIAPDLPGFGDSEKPSPARYAYGVDAFAESMADLIAAFGLRRVFVVGHGLGGAIALTLAAQHAELCEKVVLVDAMIYPYALSLRAKLPLLPIIGGVIFKQLYGRAMFRAYFESEVYSKGFEIPWARIDALYDCFNVPAARESAYTTMRATLDTRTVVARIGRVRAPTMIVWGRDDKLYPMASGQRLAREIDKSRLCVLETGNSPHEERPTEFIDAVTDFLEDKGTESRRLSRPT